MKEITFSAETGKNYLLSLITSDVRSCAKCTHRVKDKDYKAVEAEEFVLTVKGIQAKQTINSGPKSPYAEYKCEVPENELKFGINNCPNFNHE